MPYKRGGGNLLQLYDEKNGQYTDEEKQNMITKDEIGLTTYEVLKEDSIFPFHFPLEGIHSKDYNKRFLEVVKSDLENIVADPRKFDYLLSFQEGHDKSKFLFQIGYSRNDGKRLFDDIVKNTDINSLQYVEYRNKAFKCIAKTTLNGKLIATVWKLESNLNLRLVTIIPGGDKIWKK